MSPGSRFDSFGLFQRRGFIFNEGNQCPKVHGFPFDPFLKRIFALFYLKTGQTGSNNGHKGLSLIKFVLVVVQGSLSPVIF